MLAVLFKSILFIVLWYSCDRPWFYSEICSLVRDSYSMERDMVEFARWKFKVVYSNHITWSNFLLWAHFTQENVHTYWNSTTSSFSCLLMSSWVIATSLCIYHDRWAIMEHRNDFSYLTAIESPKTIFFKTLITSNKSPETISCCNEYHECQLLKSWHSQCSPQHELIAKLIITVPRQETQIK